MAEMEQEANRGTREIEFNVSGMSCHGCEQALSMLLRQHDGVETVRADAKSGKVQLTLNRDVDATELIERINAVGYEVQWDAKRERLSPALHWRRMLSLTTTPGKQTGAKVSPRDADALHFLALVSFSQQNYEDAAKYAHLALHRGSHWNWKTLSGHYQKSAMYVSQLRALEKSIQEEHSAEKRFLIGYHYLMLGYKDAARAQLARAAEKKPDDKLIQVLLRNLKQGKTQWYPFANP